MKTLRNLVAAVAVGSFALSGCATMGTSSGPKTVEEKIATCAAMVLIGAGLGAVIGNNTGSGDAGRGAGIGAAVGAGACAIWLAYQNEADQARIREAQLLAVQTGETQTAEWISPTDNLPRKVTVQPSTQTNMFYTPEGGAEQQRTCRSAATTPEFNGSTDTFGEIFCLNPDTLAWEAAPGASMTSAAAAAPASR